MAGKMAVGTAFIPEFQEQPAQQPRRRQQRRAQPSAPASVVITAVVAAVSIAFIFRIGGWFGAHNRYDRAYERSEMLRSEYTTLTLKLDSLSAERRILDMASALGMSEPDPAMVKKVTSKP